MAGTGRARRGPARAADRRRRAEVRDVRERVLGPARPARHPLHAPLGRARGSAPARPAGPLDGGRRPGGGPRAPRLRALAAVRPARAHPADAARVQAPVPAAARPLPARPRLARLERGQSPGLADRRPARARGAVLRRHRPQLPRLPGRRRGRARHPQHDHLGAALPACRERQAADLGPAQLRRRQRAARPGHAAPARHHPRADLADGDRRDRAAAHVPERPRPAHLPPLAGRRREAHRPRAAARVPEPAGSRACTSTTGRPRRS